MPNLNPDQFFHGTTRPIKDGVVRPADDADRPVSEHSMGDPGDMSEGDHAFVTKDENYAWYAARTFHKNGMRPRVYETGGAPDMKPGPWNKDHPDILRHLEVDDPDYEGVGPHTKFQAEEVDRLAQPEYASKTGFPVRNRIDIMPGHQGSFPEINWNRFREGGMGPAGVEANHPTDAQARYGSRYFAEEDVVDAAKHENTERSRTPEPSRRSGASLRAFMAGKPEPEPKHATLF